MITHHFEAYVLKWFKNLSIVGSKDIQQIMQVIFNANLTKLLGASTNTHYSTLLMHCLFVFYCNLLKVYDKCINLSSIKQSFKTIITKWFPIVFLAFFCKTKTKHLCDDLKLCLVLLLFGERHTDSGSLIKKRTISGFQRWSTWINGCLELNIGLIIIMCSSLKKCAILGSHISHFR